MFTGIIEEVGRIYKTGPGEISVQAQSVLCGMKPGDSIAVNGVCLTACHIGNSSFSADAMPETLEKSSLNSLKSGSAVNLERALQADGRFGGHFVSGHIDGTGTLTCIGKEKNAVLMSVKAPPELLKLIVKKGSVALDGISLTVVSAGERDFEVSITPYTYRNTALANIAAGDLLNIETDLIGKYVQKLLLQSTAAKPRGITADFLMRCGF